MFMNIEIDEQEVLDEMSDDELLDELAKRKVSDVLRFPELVEYLRAQPNVPQSIRDNIYGATGRII